MDTHILLFLLYLNYKLYYPSFFGFICESISIFNATKKIYTSNLSELPKKIMKNKDKLLNAKDSELKCILKLLCIVNILIPPYIKKKKNTLEDNSKQ